MHSLSHTQKHIEDKLEKIHQMEEEAQRLAQAMIPLIEASKNSSAFPNGLPQRRLHRDDDVVDNVAERLAGDLDGRQQNGITGEGGSSSQQTNSEHPENSAQ